MNKISQEIKTKLSERLCRVADMMESAADDPQFLKELSREYKAITSQLYPPTKENELPVAKVKESRKEALNQVKLYLEVEDVEQQFENLGEKKIVVWYGNVNGFPKEFTIEGVDSFYASYSGSKCITASRSLVSQKQLKAYNSFERALIEVGLKLCSGKKEKQEFFEKYATKYNEKIKSKTV